MSASKAPKRRNAEQTKSRILAAAQQVFAAKGYPQTGIRDIAALADVNSALLSRYYGSKAALFEAALIDALRLDGVLDGDRAQIGKRLAAVFIDRHIAIHAPSLVVLSTGDADAREIATRVIEAQIVRPMARWLGPPDAHARALEMVMLAMGFVLFTRQLPLISASRAQERKVAVSLAESLQRIVDRH
jgi:AcrR family transcriptional regulator